MYYLRIDGVNYPVAPESFTTETTNKNRAETLVNEQEINIIKQRGLTNITMDARLPDAEYSWAYWEQPSGSELSSGFNDPDTFIDHLNSLKDDKKSFELIIVNDEGNNFSETVTLESMTVSRSNEFVTATCEFKEYVDYTTKVVGGKITTTSRTTKKPKKSSYTVKKGDTLKKISKAMYGTQSYGSKIYSWNKSAIEKAAKKNGKKSSSSGKYLYKGTKLTLKTIK